MDFHLVSGLIMAARALAVASTNSPIGKTFTIEFETADLGAPTAVMVLGWLVHNRFLFHGLIFGALCIRVRSMLMKESFEKIEFQLFGLVSAFDFLLGEVLVDRWSV